MENPDVQTNDIQTLTEHIDQLEAKVDRVLDIVDQTDKSDLNKASKPIMAIALGAVGAKIGALIGAKAGWVTKIVNRASEESLNVAFSEAFFIPKNVINEEGKFNLAGVIENAQHQTKPVLIGSAIGAVVLGTSAASLGWFRGDRLEHAFDLLKHPINSVDRLLISDEDFLEKYPEHAKKMTKWKDKIDVANDKETDARMMVGG
jgi:hypothetical protein